MPGVWRDLRGWVGMVRGPRAGAELERACRGLARIFVPICTPEPPLRNALKVEGLVSKVRGSLGESSWSQRGHR